MGYRCETCGEHHPDLPLDLSYQRPAGYFKIPERQRDQRIKISEDLCTIDDREFYIRGVLPLPLRDSADEFCWGVWARVSAQDFDHYIDCWDADIPPDEPPLAGALSGDVRDYPDSDGLPLALHMQPEGQRPRFQVLSDDHPLGRAQREGITLAQAHAFVAPFLERGR